MRTLYDLRDGDCAVFFFGSSSGLSFRHLSMIGNHLQYAMLAMSGGSLESLMPDIFSRGSVNRILGNVRGMVAHAFEATADENQIQVAAQLLRVLRHALHQLVTGKAVQFIQPFIARNHSATKLDIFPDERVYAVSEHRHRLFVHWPDQLN